MIPEDPLLTADPHVDDAVAGITRGGWRSLAREHKFLLFILGFTAFFDGFDRGIIQVALPQIRETFALSQSQMSIWLMFVYLGALPALFVTRAADRVGRKRLLVVSIVGYMVATATTALAPSIETFVAAQFVARLFLNAEHALVLTLAAEELPARVRGFGFGYLAMQLALGFGTGSLVYGGIFEPHGIGWQWMYVLSLPPLLAIGWLRRRLPESRRFLVGSRPRSAGGAVARHLHRRHQALADPALRHRLPPRVGDPGRRVHHRLPPGGPGVVVDGVQPHVGAGRPPRHPRDDRGRQPLRPLRPSGGGLLVRAPVRHRRPRLLLAAGRHPDPLRVHDVDAGRPARRRPRARHLRHRAVPHVDAQSGGVVGTGGRRGRPGGVVRDRWRSHHPHGRSPRRGDGAAARARDRRVAVRLPVPRHPRT